MYYDAIDEGTESYNESYKRSYNTHNNASYITIKGAEKKKLKKEEKKKLKKEARSFFKRKTKQDMEEAFIAELYNNGISPYVYKAFKSAMKTKDINKTLQKIFFIFLVFITFTLIITFLIYAVDYKLDFPLPFKENLNLLKRFTNISYSVLLFSGLISLNIFSFSKLFKNF